MAPANHGGMSRHRLVYNDEGLRPGQLSFRPYWARGRSEFRDRNQVGAGSGGCPLYEEILSTLVCESQSCRHLDCRSKNPQRSPTPKAARPKRKTMQRTRI
jgi:hypothetical protein